jgi:hypothetical protein
MAPGLGWVDEDMQLMLLPLVSSFRSSYCSVYACKTILGCLISDMQSIGDFNNEERKKKRQMQNRNS